MTCWYALRTQPQKEFAAEEILKTRGFHAFCPKEYKSLRFRKGQGKRQKAAYPMMRGYLFAAFPDETYVPWIDLFRLSVITGVVGFEGKPAVIPDRDMKSVMERHGQNIPHARSVNTHRALRPGDMAEITHGTFVGQIVRIEGINRQKAQIMLELFGSTRAIELRLDQLEAA